MNSTTHSVLSEGEGQVMKEAQEVINTYLQPGIGAQRSVKAYDDTSEKFDQYVASYDYTGPQKMAQTMSSLYPEQSQRESVRILDVAAGTGLVGVEMHKVGFRNMDALDPSQGMLNVASRRDIYQRLFTEYIDDKELPIDESLCSPSSTFPQICVPLGLGPLLVTIDHNTKVLRFAVGQDGCDVIPDSYHSMVICGGMGENHIPCSALHEMIRLVKSGGYIVNMTRVEHLSNCSDYVGRLEDLMKQLESDGKWRQVTRTTFPNFLKDKDGLLMVHQVL
ncbi:methyltransferase-like protein 27 [Babylonia areolata]|uniref:methyltransferase-like protein 27 n=1 Tax=Babylonia areolata TaxID=304850 RepID=UPI003FD24CEB